MSSEPVKYYDLSQEWLFWIRLIGIVVVAFQLPIVFVLVYETSTTGRNWADIFDTDQYWVWILSQIDTAIVFSITAALLLRWIAQRHLFLVLIALLLVSYGLIGGIALYIRAIGGLGGLWSWDGN